MYVDAVTMAQPARRTPASAYSWSSIANALKKPSGSMTTMPSSQTVSLTPRTVNYATPNTSGGGGGGGFSLGEFKMPKIPTYSQDEIWDMVHRKVNASIDPLVKQIQEAIEQGKLAGETQRGRMQTDYSKVREQHEKEGKAGQRALAETMRRRNIYDSGTALGESQRARRAHAEQGTEIADTYQRAINELSDYLRQQENMATRQITDLEKQRGDMAQNMFDELWMRERDYQNQMQQQAVNNWLAQKQLELQAWQANQAAAGRASRGSVAMPEAPNYQDLFNQSIYENLYYGQPLNPAQQEYYNYGILGYPFPENNAQQPLLSRLLPSTWYKP